jgi:hypothetical protein
VEVRFEFSGKDGAHLAEVAWPFESEIPLIGPHFADVVFSTARTRKFVAERRQNSYRCLVND